jgi:penicillin amidase
MRVQGRYPARRKNEGKFLLDGSKRANGWQAFIPSDQNIMDKNPERGFVSSANQFPVDDTYPYYITGTSFENYRNRRINQVLSASSAIGPTDMMALQNDNYNLRAYESLPLFLQQLDTTAFTNRERDAYRILKSWDYQNSKESQGATYYEAWWENVMTLTWDEMTSSEVALRPPTTRRTIDLIKENPELPFFDILSTQEKENAYGVIRKAFSLAVQDIDDWIETNRSNADGQQVLPHWADYKDSYLGHLMRLEPLNIHIRAGGGRDIVNAHSRTHGPSWRMVVSLERTGMRAWATYPGGQSGNPGSAHYIDMLDRWLNGKYFVLHFPTSFVETNDFKARSITFHPSR